MDKKNLLLKNGKIKVIEKITDYEREAITISEEEKNALLNVSNDERKLFYELNLERPLDFSLQDKYDLLWCLYGGKL